MKRILFFAFILMASLSYGQLDQLHVVSKKDKLFYAYKVTKEATVYQWAKTLGLSSDNILLYNGISSIDQVKQGRSLFYPCDLSSLFRGTSIKGRKHTKLTPVIYHVQPKEGLYRIAKVYCSEDITTMMQRNKLENMNLALGQELIIGWLPSDTAEPIEYTKVENSSSDNNTATKEEPVAAMVRLDDEEFGSDIPLEDDVSYTKQKGIAIWKKSNKGYAMYVLHPTAKINSEIILYNPTVRRSVKAKVIGRIPKDTYTDDVSVIVSPATAVNLGALDTRFQVEMTYIQ